MRVGGDARRPYGDGRPLPADVGADETSALPVDVADFSQTLHSA